MRLSDTDPDVARVQLELLRKASPARCVALSLSLSRTVMEDVFVSKDRPFDRRAMERARPVARATGAPNEAVEAFELPVASAEDTVLAKLEWYRRGGESSERG